MQAKPGIEKCPHCGGRNGFVTTRVYQATHNYSWDSKFEDGGDLTVLSEKNPVCQDCGKSVRSLVTA